MFFFLYVKETLYRHLYFAGKLVSVVAKVKEQNKEILAWIRKQHDNKTFLTNLHPNLPVECPIGTVDELKELENHLKLHKIDYEALVIYNRYVFYYEVVSIAHSF